MSLPRELRAIGARVPGSPMPGGGSSDVVLPVSPTDFTKPEHETTDDHANRDRPVCVVSAPFHEANNA